MFRKPVLAIAVLIAGTFLGAAAGRIAARGIQTRIGITDLQAYADRLIHNGTRFSSDGMEARNTIRKANLPFCSDEEIALMRRVIFQSRTVKELERIQDDTIRCTAILGRLARPQGLGVPDIQYKGFRVYRAQTVGAGGGKVGYVSQWPDIAVVINPDLLQDQDEPPMTFGARYLTLEKTTHRPIMVGTIGHSVPLSNEEFFAGKVLVRDGIVYAPHCVPQFAFCAVAVERQEDMFAKTDRIHTILIWAFAVTGGLLSLLPLFFLRSQRTMESQLRRAIRNETLKLVYQPVVDLDRNVIVGAEVLLRWNDESGQAVRPDVFIGLAEDRGFISKITDYVVDHALREMQDLLIPDHFHISVNIAAQDLSDSQFCERLAAKLQVAGVLPEALALELTERSTADDESVIEMIECLHQAGHTLYLDDFGTGYSSLAYLHQLKVSAIKIDKSFTRTVGTGAIAANLVPQLLAITDELNLRVVVEGIETYAQVEYFRNARSGIHAQGFLLGRPMPASELKLRLASQQRLLSSPVTA